MTHDRMLPEGCFDGRVVLVTGGGTGLGLEIARRAAALGARVVIASRNADHLAAGAAEIRTCGAEALTIPTDVRDYRQVRAMVRTTLDRFGRLDALVNNAAGNFVRPAERLPEEAFRNVIDIVLNGSFFCSRAAGRSMIERGGGGSILNILATYAWTGGPGTIHSACAKAGVLAMTRTLAVEWARHGIRVNGVAPGPFESEGAQARLWPTPELEQSIRRRIPLGRFARTSEVANAALYLLSDFAEYVTGEVLTLDGGAWLGQPLGGSEADGSIPLVRRKRPSHGV